MLFNDGEIGVWEDLEIKKHEDRHKQMEEECKALEKKQKELDKKQKMEKLAKEISKTDELLKVFETGNDTKMVK